MERIIKVLKFAINSPIFPYWLWKHKQERGIIHSIDAAGKLFGKVLEVGAGDGGRKNGFIQKYPSINDYCASDFSSWDTEFYQYLPKKLSFKEKILSHLYGYHSYNRKIDKVCSATDLPFEDELFDFHLSFEVLEHIDDPFKYYSEAARVLKKGGKSIISVPYLFRMHGGEPNHEMDTFRYSNGFFYEIQKRYPLKIIEIYSNSGLGTSLATLIIQYFAVRLTDSKRNIFIRLEAAILIALLSIPIQLLGLLIDINPDHRFTSRLHVVFEKI